MQLCVDSHICMFYRYGMAKLSDLIRTVADLTDVPLSSVTVVARVLREADFIASGGRGRGGANMGSADAAHLLLGVITLGDTTKAAEVVGSLQQATVQGASARLGNTKEFFTGAAAAREFPRLAGVSLPKALDYTLAHLKPRDGQTLSGAYQAYDPERDGDPDWKRSVGEQTPVSLAMRANKTDHWDFTLAIDFENGSAIDLDFGLPEPTKATPRKKLRMLQMHLLHAPIIDGVVRCVRDEPPRQWPEKEG